MANENNLILRANAEALIPEEVTRAIIGDVAQGSAMLRLGSRMPDMGSRQLKMPVLTGLVQAGFVEGDTGLKPVSALSWDKVTITAEELAVIVPIPESVLADAEYDLWSEVRPRIVEAFARQIDQAILHGTGKPASWPEGIVAQAKAAGNAVGLTANLYQDICGVNGLLAKVEEGGCPVNGFVGALPLRARLRGAADANGQPVFHAAYAQGSGGAMRYELTGLPIAFPQSGALNPQEALLLAGDFSCLRYAIRQDVTYKLLDQATLTDAEGKVLVNLAQQDCVALRAVMRLGWALPRPVNAVSGQEYFPFAVLQQS